jgi:riboflavin kinase/FMN adenylyltransferase
MKIVSVFRFKIDSINLRHYKTHTFENFSFYSRFQYHKKKTILRNFDGVHLAKKNLGKSYCKIPIDKYEKSRTYFFSHPRMVLEEKSNIKLLNTISENRVIRKIEFRISLFIHSTKVFQD